MTMTSWHAYPKVWNLGHPAVKELLLDPVVVQEKIDGSQFSFGLFGPAEDMLEIEPNERHYQLQVRSKGAILQPDAPEKMFVRAVESVRERVSLLHTNWTYRCEYLAKPKHNALSYDRIPLGNLVLFDVNTDEEAYLGPNELRLEAERIGIEAVSLLHVGKIENIEQFREYLDMESELGGQKIEGVVIKNYSRFGSDKKALMGKYVSEEFREIHEASWKAANPGRRDVLEALIAGLTTPARWNKAIHHLAERGELEHSPRDIGKLIKEVQRDVAEECRAEIADALMKWAMPQIGRGIIRGLPEWYKEKLLERQFADGTN